MSQPDMPRPPERPSPVREAARKIDSYLMNYGTWDEHEVALARQHELVIVDPNDDGVDRALIHSIQDGVNPADSEDDVLVLCYLSVGEDLRSADHNDGGLAGDPRFAGDGTGPRVDPRGPHADGQSLDGIDPLGLPSPGGAGWASWYLDDLSVRHSSDGTGDGIPDRNGIFGGYFVNAGDPAWFDALQDMTVDGPDGMAGLREILTADYGRGLACDGVFMDTFDTAFPNHWTDWESPNETKFEWTAPGFADFVHRLRDTYPDALILQNRALFFFNPDQPHYAHHPGSALDFVLFESYRLNSGDWNNPDDFYYPDNRYNVTPELMAEAGRYGFRVLSLGYAEGPSDQMSELTLLGQSDLGFDSLIEDIWVAEREAGFRHYISDHSVTLVNRFVLDHADRTDSDPPRWTSTYNDNDDSYAPGKPTPRIGIQKVVPGPGSLTVYWDVALDLHRVRYALYYQTEPFDFGAGAELSAATRVPLPQTQSGPGYADGSSPGVYAHQATINNLDPGATYHLVIRAFDTRGHEDTNQIVLTASPN